MKAVAIIKNDFEYSVIILTITDPYPNKSNIQAGIIAQLKPNEKLVEITLNVKEQTLEFTN